MCGCIVVYIAIRYEYLATEVFKPNPTDPEHRKLLLIIKIMTKKTKKNIASEAASALGRLGGRAVVKKHGKSHMAELGKKGMNNRWKKKIQGE